MRAEIGVTPWAAHALVTLDGKLVEKCVVADSGLGEVEVYDTDSTGQLVVGKDGSLVRKTLRGQVRVYVQAEHAWMVEINS